MLTPVAAVLAHSRSFGDVLLVALAGCAARGGEEEERGYTFTTLEYPGATRTVASAINDSGHVAGWYRGGEAGGEVKGYLYRDGEYTSIQYPEAAVTQISGIGADGALVGAYRRAGDPGVAWHGFMRTPAGEFVEIHHPDHPHSMVQRILPDGSIIGCYHDGDFMSSMHGMVVAGGAVIAEDGSGTMYTGATADRRKMVGNLSIARRGFVRDGDRVTHIEAPGSAATEVWDINAAGVIVGVAVDTADVARGFVLDNGRWTVIEVPDSRATVTFGINARGEIVGGWDDAEGTRRGYLARRE